MLELVAAIVAKLPTMISAGMDVYDLYAKTRAVIDANKGPTEADWNALDAQVAALQVAVRDTSQDVR